MSGQHIANHQIDPATGMLFSPAYEDAFTPEKKSLFLESFRAHELNLTETCKDVGVDKNTLYKHLRIDPVFKQQFQDYLDEYADKVEWVSRQQALNPKSGFMDRMAQLRWLRPEKYHPEKSISTPGITINIDSKFLESMKNREKVIEAQIVSTPEISNKTNLNELNNLNDVQKIGDKIE